MTSALIGTVAMSVGPCFSRIDLHHLVAAMATEAVVDGQMRGRWCDIRRAGAGGAFRPFHLYFVESGVEQTGMEWIP